MVIFPIRQQHNDSKRAVPIWEAVEESQQQSASEYWLVTQPAHAVLAGEMAAALREDLFGPIDAIVSRSIALHDAGWSMDDAEQIQRLRSDPKLHPRSFLHAAVEQALDAWTHSIETVEKFAPIGGYLVSRHFERISQREGRRSDTRFQEFRKREKQRQQKLRRTLRQDEQTLERLVDALQFCDVLSLFLCCGSSRTVKIADQKMTISRIDEGYKIEPSPFAAPRQFTFPALRHPILGEKKAKSGATFYLNL